MQNVLTVKQPIGDWGNRDAAFVDLLLGAKHHSCGVTAISPAPDADTCLIEIIHIRQQVAALQ